jgi:hypothetical protein
MAHAHPSSTGASCHVWHDTDPQFSRGKGIIAFEIEGPGKVKISHRNIWLKTLPGDQSVQAK